jgi:polyferredoxin
MKYYLRIIVVIILLFSSQLIAQCDKECSAKCNKKNTSSLTQTTAKSNEDEFLPYNSNESKSNSSKDEFIEYDSKTDTIKAINNIKNQSPNPSRLTEQKLFFPILSLITTILAGIFVRFRPTRKLRGVFLASSAITLGFYIGACPCPISSFSYTIIALSGGRIIWENMIWFLALIPITYLFHKVWCGWICHLGALQEFLFIPAAKLKFLESKKSQKVIKYLRYIFVFTLIIQVVITHSYLFDQIDPFRTAYNLGYNATYTEWILLGLLILSSIFIYRPFCQSVCPIGLVLGWVTKIKGASVIGTGNDCVSCSVCGNACNINAITKKQGNSQLDNKDCIACGECADACRKSGINFFRNNKEHRSIVQMGKKD